MEKVSKDAELSRALRKALGGITQAELAARLLLSRNYISQIEAELKFPSERVRSQMQRLLMESARDIDKVSNPPGDHEDHASDRGEQNLEGEIRRYIEEQIALARGVPTRMGWLLEQIKAKVRSPAHWHDDIHLKLLERAHREGLMEHRVKDQSSSGKAQGGAAL